VLSPGHVGDQLPQNFIGKAPQVKVALVVYFRVGQRNRFKMIRLVKQARHQGFLDTQPLPFDSIFKVSPNLLRYSTGSVLIRQRMATLKSRDFSQPIDDRSGGVCVVLIFVFVALTIFLPANFCIASDSKAAAAHRLELRGAIKDALGRPIADAEVRLEQGGRVIARARTDSAGTFLFKPVAPGSYHLVASKQEFKQKV
jgi:hypothetical protein